MFQPDSSVSAAAPFDGFRPQRPRAASMMAQDVVQKIAEEGRAQLQAEFHPQFNMMPPSEMESQPPSDTEARAEGPAQEEDNARQAQPQPDELQQSVNDEMRQSHGRGHLNLWAEAPQAPVPSRSGLWDQSFNHPRGTQLLDVERKWGMSEEAESSGLLNPAMQ